MVKTSTEQRFQRKRWSDSFLLDWQPGAQAGCSSQKGESATPLHQDVVPPHLREVSAKDELRVLTVDNKIPPDDNLDVDMGENTPTRYVFALLNYIGALLTCCSPVTVQVLRDADGDILSGPHSQQDTSGMLDCSICREKLNNETKKSSEPSLEATPGYHRLLATIKVSMISRQARFTPDEDDVGVPHSLVRPVLSADRTWTTSCSPVREIGGRTLWVQFSPARHRLCPYSQICSHQSRLSSRGTLEPGRLLPHRCGGFHTCPREAGASTTPMAHAASPPPIPRYTVMDDHARETIRSLEERRYAINRETTGLNEESCDRLTFRDTFYVLTPDEDDVADGADQEVPAGTKFPEWWPCESITLLGIVRVFLKEFPGCALDWHCFDAQSRTAGDTQKATTQRLERYVFDMPDTAPLKHWHNDMKPESLEKIAKQFLVRTILRLLGVITDRYQQNAFKEMHGGHDENHMYQGYTFKSRYDTVVEVLKVCCPYPMQCHQC
jgi:hypothetical protein